MQQTLFPKNSSFLMFSELLALEITKSNDVQICQFILIRWNQTCFSHGHIISIYITHLMFNSFFKKMQMSHGFKINLEIKVIKKVKESYLKLVKSELKQYKRRWKENYDFFSLDHGNRCLNQEGKANNFSNIWFQIIHRYLKRWQNRGSHQRCSM